MRHVMALTVALIGSMTSLAGGEQTRPLVVHEWGTFTAFQDERGEAFAAINSDDERLPDFTHRIFDRLVSAAASQTKAGPRHHPRVTMRLETPVVYFHPPAGASLPMTVDVSVEFRGGWLTEFYPSAAVQIDGEAKEGPRYSVAGLREATVGRLTWNGLKVGVDARGPETQKHVWLAPRQVNSAAVMNEAGEAERYLFYRGAGRRDAPVRVVRAGDVLRIHSQLDGALGIEEMPVKRLWLADFRDDGTCAFRVVEPVVLGRDRSKVLATAPASFGEAAYSSANLRVLRKQMHGALVEDGLFADEATALLSTWELSYFKSGGLRLFFLVPRAWTDAVLPIRVSGPHELVRTMVGRVEIVTPVQREAARHIGAAGASAEEQRRLYESLGRFRNALLIDEQTHRPTAGLAQFLKRHDIRAYGSVGAEEFVRDSVKRR